MSQRSPVSGSSVTIVPVQCRAARALLGWSQVDLAEAAGVSRATLAEFENERHRPLTRTLVEIRRVLEGAGVTFIDQDDGGPGVRLRDPLQ